jgi:hypothetical protein
MELLQRINNDNSLHSRVGVGTGVAAKEKCEKMKAKVQRCKRDRHNSYPNNVQSILSPGQGWYRSAKAQNSTKAPLTGNPNQLGPHSTIVLNEQKNSTVSKHNC